MQNGIHKYILILAIFLLAFTTSSHAELIPQSGWSLLSVDSEETAREDGAASNAFDGDVNTIWHTVYADTPPHTIDIALGNAYQLDGFTYLPRQDGNHSGMIFEYEISTSSDGENWNQPVAKGEFAGDMSEKEVIFAKPVKVKFIRLRAVSELNRRNRCTSCAEINIILGSGFNGSEVHWLPRKRQ